MNEIKIKTLTAVHVGSGETLQAGTDFVKGRIDEVDFLSIVDPKKVLELIGDENVQQWVTAIERKESTKDVVNQIASKATLTDYSKRMILEWSFTKNTDTLKEHIHDGRGLPYIPGSSIKGAIRTAVLASLAENVCDVGQKIDKTKRDKEGNPIPNHKGQIEYKADAKRIESELFGSDPNKDVFRFLQVGDAYFGENYEIAIRMVNLNEREKQSFWDDSKSQLIEAIEPEDEASFRLKLNKSGYDLSKKCVQQLPDCMCTVQSLFETINTHTRKLLESEIDYWKEREPNDDSDKVALYIEKVQSILEEVNECRNGEECVLRIGHGSGWRFITGAWTERLNNFPSVVVPVSRPKNFKYEQYDFPKTRRVDDECELLGFVKLTIVK